MAYSQESILAVAGVLVILLGVIFYNNMRAMRPRRGSAKSAAPADPFVNRYVHHEGAIVGQVIAIDGDQVILRQGTVHKAVPVAQLERAGDDLRLLGTVDWMESERQGAAWLAKQSAAEPPTGP